MRRPVLLSLGIVWLLAGVGGCATPVPRPNPVVTVQCLYPVMSPLAQTTELQSKGGINVSLAPSSFICSDAVQTRSQEVVPDLAEGLNFAMSGGKPEYSRLIETVSIPVAEVQPNRIAFRIKINNQMPRVFRGSGTVVLYNISGKNASISSQDYAELANLIVPPRTEQEVTIYGPPFRDVPDKTSLGIFLYDVVTKTDAAGNITEKQNFEWFYNYQLQVKEDVREITKSRHWVSR